MCLRLELVLSNFLVARNELDLGTIARCLQPLTAVAELCRFSVRLDKVQVIVGKRVHLRFESCEVQQPEGLTSVKVSDRGAFLL